MTKEQQKTIAALWYRGNLKYKLRDHQFPLYNFLSELFRLGWKPGDDRESIRRVLNCARRFGKTFTTCLLIVELCIKYPGFIVRYAAPTEKALRKIIKPNLRVILKDCPKELRPVWNNSDSCFIFPKSGAEFHLSGTDKDNAEKLRGTGADLAVADEAGSMPQLHYITHDILLPQTLDNKGAMIVISTPPPTPGHEFANLCMEAMADGDYLIQTINDNSYIDEVTKAKYCKASGGPNSTTWRREYLCEFVVDQSLAVVPEFDAEAQIRLVKEWERPKYFYPGLSLDVGYFDSTFVIFGYYDFLAAKAIIEDELVIKRARTDEIANGIKAKETALYVGREMYFRKTDIDHRLIADMAANHKLALSPTAKDDKEAQVNMIREWIKSDRIIIHPRCVNLIAQLRSAIWNNKRTEFERIGNFGHFDGVDALCYFLRNLPIHLNPYPAWDPNVNPVTHFIPKEYGVRETENSHALESAFDFWKN